MYESRLIRCKRIFQVHLVMPWSWPRLRATLGENVGNDTIHGGASACNLPLGSPSFFISPLRKSLWADVSHPHDRSF